MPRRCSGQGCRCTGTCQQGAATGQSGKPWVGCDQSIVQNGELGRGGARQRSAAVRRSRSIAAEGRDWASSVRAACCLALRLTVSRAGFGRSPLRLTLESGRRPKAARAPHPGFCEQATTSFSGAPFDAGLDKASWMAGQQACSALYSD